MNLNNLLSNTAAGGIKAVFNTDLNPEEIQVQDTKKEFKGDRTIVVFPLLRYSKKSPEITATELGEYLKEHSTLVNDFNVVKGFLNLEISHSFWLSFLADNYSNDDFGIAERNSKPMVMVEYSSPNTNKPLHLGHLRNNFLGYSVAEILKANGHDVKKVQIINDRGIHICKSMVAWSKFGDDETPESSGLKGDKLVGKYYVRFETEYKSQIKSLMAEGKTEDEAKAEAPIIIEARETLKKWENREEKVYKLWSKMNSWVYSGFAQTYEQMGVDFDKLYYESNTYLTGKDIVEDGLESGVFFKKEDGSVWCDLTDDGLDEKLVLRADGTSVYMTQDIGTAVLRFQDFKGLSYQIYTVGNEQEYHFKVLFHILKKLGYDDSDSNYHLSYGMVELPEGKMKSREGTVVDADDLMAEMIDTAAEISASQGKLEDLSPAEKQETFKTIGYGALKYFLLKVDPRKGMMFNPNDSVDFQGNTGPFIQYTYVRAHSLMNKAAKKELKINTDITLTDSELTVIKRLYEFPIVLKEAAKLYNPAVIANYTFDLVKDFNSFYQNTNILKEKNDELVDLRLAFTKLSAATIKNSMSLLGINMPTKM